jgi:hypothetical protein
MTIRNIRGLLYRDSTLIGIVGTDFISAKVVGTNLDNVAVVIEAAAHSGDEDIVLGMCRYDTLDLDGTRYANASAAVTALNAVLTEAATFKLPAIIDGTDLPTAAESAATGELYVSSNIVRVKG